MSDPGEPRAGVSTELAQPGLREGFYREENECLLAQGRVGKNISRGRGSVCECWPEWTWPGVQVPVVTFS